MKPFVNISRQRGVTLAITLVFLFVLLIVGISAVRISLVEEKMTGNMRDKHIAFESAETALAEAEQWIWNEQNYPTATSTGSSGVWRSGDVGAGRWWTGNTDTWWNTKAVSATSNSFQHAAPRYIVEERAFLQKGEDLSIGQGGTKSGKFVYQITSRGYGGSAETRVHLRSTYIKRF